MTTVAARFASIRRSQPSVPAHIAFVWARDVPTSYDWEYPRHGGNVWKETELHIDGFTVRVQAITSDHLDDGDLGGAFSDKYRTGAVRHPEAYKKSRGWEHGWNRKCEWFHPDCTYAEHFSALRRTHGKHEAHTLARSYVLRDLKRALKAGDDWHPVGIEVSVSKNGITLGEASVWGFSTEMTDEDLSFSAKDVIYEAIAEAKAALKLLCDCDAEKAVSPAP